MTKRVELEQQGFKTYKNDAIRVVFEESKQQASAYDGEQIIGECQYSAAAISKWIISHTGVRPEFNGRGIAKRLVECVIAEARARGVRIVPLCSYAKHIMSGKEEYKDVLVKKDVLVEYVNRAGTNCYKWDSDCARGLLPLWVADMDFKAPAPVIDAMQRRLEHGVFGYQYVPEVYYDAIANWFARRHNWRGISRTNIIYTTGVVAAISAILRAVTQPGDGVLVQTPAYNCFFSCVTNLECRLIDSPLAVNHAHYEVDWQNFEQQVSQARVFLLCNPHNPTGRVWTRDELQRMATICERHNVFVIADEIHCEFTFPGIRYTPYATVAHNNNYCTCVSPSKAFNIAGLHCANIFVPDADIYQRIDHAVNVHEVCELNPFGFEALIAAYNECEAWLDVLQQVIYNNYCFLSDFVRQHLPQQTVTRAEGTFLAWVDVSACGISSEELCQRLADKQKVLFNPAEMYGGKGYIRINIATSRENIEKALRLAADGILTKC